MEELEREVSSCGYDGVEAVVGSIGYNLLVQGKEQGITIGRAQGIPIGEARGLAKVLTRRFGKLPSDVEERINAAELAELEQWYDRAIDAPDLNSVFEQIPN